MVRITDDHSEGKDNQLLQFGATENFLPFKYKIKPPPLARYYLLRDEIMLPSLTSLRRAMQIWLDGQ